MYVPDAFRLDDRRQILRVLRENSFATLLTGADAGIEATHLPILVAQENPLVLTGHMARANDHWKALPNRESLVIFIGPHRFISPAWYVTEPNVPTWNYIAVHCHGEAEIVENELEVLAHLNDALDFFDPALRQDQPQSTEEPYLRKMLRGVVAFRLQVARIEAKAKLNQNKTAPDRLAVRERLLSSDSEVDLSMAAFMRPN